MFKWIKRKTQDKRVKRFYKVIVEDLEECESKYDINFAKDQYRIRAKVYTPSDGLKYVYFMDLQGHMVKSTLDKKHDTNV